MTIRKKMLIGGVWTDAEDGRTILVTDPATGETCGTVPVASEADVVRAVDAAEAAFPAWSKTTPFYRGEILRKAAALVLENSRAIAELMTREQGKPLAESEGEVRKGADILRYYAEEGERVYGRIIPNADGNDIVSHVVYQPIGVVACLSPWNYPIELLAWKVAAALASGCTCILKVPSETPLSPIAFVETMLGAGIPSGVVNVVTGKGSQVGSLLMKEPRIKKIAFTGSTSVGKEIMSGCADTLKHLSLELGGSLPMIVCEDSNLEAAATGATRRSFRNMGQICIAINRIYVARPVYEKFLTLFADKTRQLTMGNGLLEQCDLGPMCTQKGMATATQHVQDALSKGAAIVTGGKPPEGEGFAGGNFFEPTILKDVDHTMLVMQEETFGPIAGVMPFDTIEEAIALANDSSYGLAAIVYTEGLSLANRLASELQAGNVAINNVDAGVINAPYGGWKDSGFGHEHGPEGLYEYLHVKHIRIRTL